MRPLEEYMLFTKTGSEKVNVSNSHGVRSAQCSANFDVDHKVPAGPTNLNMSQVRVIEIIITILFTFNSNLEGKGQEMDGGCPATRSIQINVFNY